MGKRESLVALAAAASVSSKPNWFSRLSSETQKELLEVRKEYYAAVEGGAVIKTDILLGLCGEKYGLTIARCTFGRWLKEGKDAESR